MSTPKPSRLQLVGNQKIINANRSLEGMSFYGDLFSRLPREVKNTGDRSRYVGYRSFMGGSDFLHFFGIEVNGIESIPEGMIAWDLSDSHLTVWGSKDGNDSILSQESIEWQWLEPSPCGSGRYTGEFIAGCREYWLSANSPVGLRETEVSNDEVHLVDYDPSWPEEFYKIESWLRESLGPEVALRVEHYGSTAIPGMPAKPVIDVLVEIPSFLEAKQKALHLFNNEEWEYWWYSDHMVFIKREKLMGERTHHIHLALPGHGVWNGLTFRDYLRSNQEDASRYAALKHELAATHRQSREEYTQAKTAFVREVIAKAMQDS